jgi:hypothetical protein
VEDVIVQNNVFKGSGEGINILGSDNIYPSQKMKRVKIVNNLLMDISSAKWEGSGYFIQIADGEDVEIANNTVFQDGTMLVVYGSAPKNFRFRDNILGHGIYGTHIEGSSLASNPAAYFSSVMKNNVIVNSKNIPDGDLSIPGNNFKILNYQQVGFSNFSAKNFSLAATSKFKGKAIGGKDIGANIEDIMKAMPKELFARISTN